MTKSSRHEFLEFMQSLQDSLAQEYARIQKRVSEDPGTAGDQAEENWATILRNWLPATYPVVTKGRLLDTKGQASPQIDVLVLHPSYPIALRDKKLYFAGGVVAAFECKLKLRSTHLKKTIKNAMLIKSMFPIRTGSPYRELHQPIIYGLLAHSHDWKLDAREAFWAILDRVDEIYDDESTYPSPELLHPRYALDLICVADIGTAYFSKRISMGPNIDKERRDAFGDNLEGGIKTLYTHQMELQDIVNKSRHYTIAALVERLTTRMAYEDPSLQPFAEYLRLATNWGGVGRVTLWKPEVFSENVREKLSSQGCVDGFWSEWNSHY